MTNSIICDELITEGTSKWVRKNGELIECFTQCEEESAADMVAHEMIRVKVPGKTDSMDTLWAAISDFVLINVEIC